MKVGRAVIVGPTGEKRSSPRVTLVRPTMVSSVGTWSNPITPPLGLAYLASSLREKSIHVDVVDGIAAAIDQFHEDDGYLYQGLTIEQTVERIDERADVIGVSCMFTQDWPWMARLLGAIREHFPAALIIAGGEHITALPEFSMRVCDALDLCVLGEGEETLVDLAEHLQAGREPWDVPGTASLRDGVFHKAEPRKRIRAVDKIPRPAWDLFEMEVYLSSRNGHGVSRGRSMGILSTRGCPYKCTFCSNPVMYGPLWLARSPSDVLDEIEYYIDTYGAENIDFYDLTMILKRSWVLEFCQLIEERGLQFTWQLPTGTRSEVIDDEVAAAIYRTGCRNITYSPESGSVETLRQIKKRVKVPKLLASTSAALRQGIHVKCNIVIGFPEENRRQIWQTVRFCWKLAVLGVHDVGVFLFSPYPGSELFEDLRKRGTIQELDEQYFRSLVALMDPFAPSKYCHHVSSAELVFWRWLTMGSFFALQFLLRPMRFVRLVKNVIRNDSDTVLAQRVGAIIRRPVRPPSVRAPDAAAREPRKAAIPVRGSLL